MTIIFSFLENVAEENLFYIVSPKDLVLAKVCFERFKALATGLNIILLQHPFDFVEWQC